MPPCAGGRSVPCIGPLTHYKPKCLICKTEYLILVRKGFDAPPCCGRRPCPDNDVYHCRTVAFAAEELKQRTAGAGMDGRAERSGDFAGAFEGAFARLQVMLEMVCVNGDPWPERVRVGVRRALAFAAKDPAAAGVLTNAALAQGGDGLERYERLMAYLADLLEPGRAETPYGADLPPTTERSIAGGIATIIANRVDRGRAEELPGLSAEMVQFILTPYIGTEEARRIAMAGDWPNSQPDR